MSGHMDQDREQLIEAYNPQAPHLGLATTEMLFRELICRFAIIGEGRHMGIQTKIDNALMLAEMLGTLTAPEREYRTVDSY